MKRPFCVGFITVRGQVRYNETPSLMPMRNEVGVSMLTLLKSWFTQPETFISMKISE